MKDADHWQDACRWPCIRSRDGVAVMSDRKWPASPDSRLLAKDADDAIDQVGRALYGELWLREVSKADWETSNSYGMPGAKPVGLPVPASTAARHAQARLRSLITYLQLIQVYQFLYEQGIELADDGFDSTGFAAWFLKWQPDSKPRTSTARRIDAVKKVLRDHGNPGRGGPVTWKTFCNLVRKTSGQRCTDKTIQRDVTTLRNMTFGTFA
jgi:hypothetical protein